MRLMIPQRQSGYGLSHKASQRHRRMQCTSQTVAGKFSLRVFANVDRLFTHSQNVQAIQHTGVWT